MENANNIMWITYKAFSFINQINECDEILFHNSIDRSFRACGLAAKEFD